jgi:hypothetical protein
LNEVKNGVRPVAPESESASNPYLLHAQPREIRSMPGIGCRQTAHHKDTIFVPKIPDSMNLEVRGNLPEGMAPARPAAASAFPEDFVRRSCGAGSRFSGIQTQMPCLLRLFKVKFRASSSPGVLLVRALVLIPSHPCTGFLRRRVTWPSSNP